MKKITVSILSVLMMLSMVFSSSVFAAEKEVSAWDAFLGLFGAQTSDVSDVGVEYRGHVENKGDFPLDGTWIQGPDQLGTVGEGLRLEAFWIKLAEDAPAGLHIKYQVHVQNKGWMGFVNDGAMAGTEGEGLRIEAIQISLVDDEGNIADGYSVEYRGHVQNIGDTEWYADGDQLGTTGSGLRLEALEIKIVQTKADMTAYNAAVAAAGALTEADYTAESWAALQTALAVVVTEDNTQAEVDAATAAINAAIDGLEMVTRIDTVVATGAKNFTVTFNQAVDTDNDTLTVKKGSVSVNLDDVTFSDDGKTGIITTTSKFTEGTYTVTLTTADNTSSKAVDVEDETVASINVITETAPLNPSPVTINTVDYVAKATVFASYEVYNQYGEEMSNQSITWTASTGGDVDVDTVNNKLTIGNYDENTVFVPGATVYLTGVHAFSGTVVNDSVVVGLESKADKVVYKGIYDLTENELVDTLPAGFADNEYDLLFEVNDQYGNKIDTPDFDQLIFTSSNPLFVLAPDETTRGTITLTEDDVDTEYQTIDIDPGTNSDKGGSATIQAISSQTGTTSSFVLSSEAAPALKTFTMSAPSDLIAEGETVEIPFTAVDQFGNAVTDFDDLNGEVTLSASSGTLSLTEKADGTAKLTYTAATGVATEDVDFTAYVTSLVSNSGSFSSLMLTVKDAAVPTTINGLTSDVLTTIAAGGSDTIDYTEIIVADQYGRTMDSDDVATWITAAAGNGIIVTSSTAATSPFAVTDTTPTLDTGKNFMLATTTTITVTGSTATNATATENLVFSLTTDGTTVDSASSKSVTFTLATQSQFASYEVADIGPMYNDATVDDPTEAAYDKTVSVYGVKSNGAKVLLPADLIELSFNTDNLTSTENVISDVASGGYIDTDFEDYTGATINKEVTVTVSIENDATGTLAAQVQKTLIVSNDTPVITEAEFDTDLVDEGAAFVEMDGSGAFAAADMTAVIDTDTVYDQYGVDYASTIADKTPTITITGLTKVTGSSFVASDNGTATTSVTGAEQGDKFIATFTYVDGISISVNFTVSDIL